MLFYAKIINDITKECYAPNQIEAEKMGFEQLDLDVGYDGNFYLSGYAPNKPVELLQKEVREIRNIYLENSDKYMLIDFPITVEEKQKYIEYRQYLRDYTNQPNWWEHNPKTFEEWDNTNES